MLVALRYEGNFLGIAEDSGSTAPRFNPGSYRDGDQPAYPRAYDLLIVDEAHNVAPSGRGRYATHTPCARKPSAYCLGILNTSCSFRIPPQRLPGELRCAAGAATIRPRIVAGVCGKSSLSISGAVLPFLCIGAAINALEARLGIGVHGRRECASSRYPRWPKAPK